MSMSDDDKEKDPDYQPEFSTIEMQDLHSDDVNVNEVIGVSTATGTEIEEGKFYMQPSKSTDTEVEHVGHSPYYKPKPQRDRRTSLIWTKFTIIDKKNQIASCNICDRKMSIRSTSGNLKKHLERKHGYSIKLGVLPIHKKPKIITPTPRPKLPQLAGISEDGITVKVVGENGEEEHYEVVGEQYLSEEVVQGDAQEHDYTAMEQHTEEGDSETLRIGRVRSLNESQSSYSRREPPQLYPQQRPYAHLDDKAKRKRIMELQTDCLENKKYNMQLEALLMEQKLNLPRSIYTTQLRYADVQTRATQTEVGGSDTRVFYVTDRRGSRPLQQMFACQDMDDCF